MDATRQADLGVCEATHERRGNARGGTRKGEHSGAAQSVGETGPLGARDAGSDARAA